MDIMRRAVLRLAGIGAITIAAPQLASGLDPERSPALKLAMGPTSAAQKPGGPPTAPANPVPTCQSPDVVCTTPHHHSKRRRAGAPSR